MSSKSPAKPHTGPDTQSVGFTKRLDLRVAEHEKDEIDQAAALEGTTTSAFVRRAILRAARETIHTHTTFRLTQEGGRQFVEALNNPPAPSEHLRALVRECSCDDR